MPTMTAPTHTHYWTGQSAIEYTNRSILTPDALDELWRREYHVPGRRALVREMLHDFGRETRILEVGCNAGNQLALLREAGFANVWGVDILPHAVEVASKRGFRAFVADGARLPFVPDSFDLAMTCWCLCHIPDAVPVLAEMLRVAPRIFLTEPVDGPEKPGYTWYRDIVHVAEEQLGARVIAWQDTEAPKDTLCIAGVLERMG